MSALRDLQDYLQEDFNREMMKDKTYHDAEEKLQLFIEHELPHDKQEEIESLLIDVESIVLRSAIEIGMKFGAKLTAEILK